MDKKTREWIIHKLRELTVIWEGRNEALRKAKVKVNSGQYKNGKIKYLNHYKCVKCGELFRASDVQVDHIEEVGRFTDWNTFIDRLFCDVTNLQVMCVTCHSRKTARFNMFLRGRREKA